jgi:hypothetical protein
MIGWLLLGCAAREAAPPEAPSEPPQEAPADAAAPDLPTWDEVPSPHPPGATDRLRPALLVGPDGRCYKTWDAPMARGPRGDRRGTCGGELCMEILCDPVRRDAVLARP